MGHHTLKPNRILLIGSGDLGSALGLRMQDAGFEVLAVRRSIEKLPSGLNGKAVDYTNIDSLRTLADDPAQWVVMTPKPVDSSVAGYEAGYLQPLLNLLQFWRGTTRTFVFVSSTRVYGDCSGNWVDEDTALPAPTDPPNPGHIIAAAEQALWHSDHRGISVRFGGIYGALPSRLLDRVGRGQLCAEQPIRYSNRIHRDDCVGFLQHLLLAGQRGESLRPCYLGVDDAPVPQWQVESWLARRLGVEVVQSDYQPDPRMRGGNRRCRNLRLHESGYQLLYPDYRAGYGAMLDTLA